MAAGLDAGIAIDTDILIPDDLAVFEAQGMDRTGLDAVTAVTAHMDGFRIVAEAAVELTALKKDGHPIGWSIDIGKRNDLINGRCLHDAVSFDPRHEHHPGLPCQRP